MLIADVVANSWHRDLVAFNWIELWDSMSWFSQAIVTLLALMFARAIGVFTVRTIRFSSGRRQSRRFVSEVNVALTQHDVASAVAVARRYPDSHIGEVVASGLLAFASGSSLTRTDAVAATTRALSRAEARSHSSLKIGLDTLATIASTAPFLGLLGTVIGIMGAFREWSGSRLAWLAFITRTLSESLLTTAMGLLVAVVGLWFYNYLASRLEVLDAEMSNASSELLGYLAAHPDTRESESLLPTAPLWMSESVAPAWEVRYDPQRMILLSVGSFSAYTFLEFVRALLQ